MPYRPALSLCLILRPESLLCNVSKTLFHSLNSATPTTLIIGQPLIQIILDFTGSCFTMYSLVRYFLYPSYITLGILVCYCYVKHSQRLLIFFFLMVLMLIALLALRWLLISQQSTEEGIDMHIPCTLVFKERQGMTVLQGRFFGQNIYWRSVDPYSCMILQQIHSKTI